MTLDFDAERDRLHVRPFTFNEGVSVEFSIEPCASLRKAATALVDKVNAVCQSAEFKNVFAVAELHDGPYRGENWLKEWQALRDALGWDR